jgi:hypothetical protein
MGLMFYAKKRSLIGRDRKYIQLLYSCINLMIIMTILNVYISDQEKENLKKVVQDHEIKSMSEFVRNVINEKLITEAKAPAILKSEITIPEFVPKNKYVLFTQENSIGAVGDTPAEVASIAAAKGVKPPFLIKYNGKNPPKPKHFVYSLNIGKVWHYATIEEKTYPILEIELLSGEIAKKLYATVDTAASLCVVREKGSDEKKYNKEIDSVAISTAGGEIEKILYKGEVILEENKFSIHFITAPIDTSLPFDFLIGRNLLDQFDAFFFGKKQMLLLRLA